jgi:sugar lactone lactonase YvrE
MNGNFRRVARAGIVWVALVAPAAAAAQAADPQRQLLSALTALWDQQPRHVGAIDVAARTAAALGDRGAALRWLDRLAEVGLDDELDPDDFAALAEDPEDRVRAARFAVRARPIGTAEAARELQCADLLPEGTAWDMRRGELLLSSGRRRTVVAVRPDGQCRDVVARADAGLLSVLGMQLDAARDVLWVASAAAPFMIDARPGGAGRTALAGIDLASGRVEATFALPGPGLLNDLTLAADGSVYVTESRGGTVYRLAPGASTLVAIVPAESFESPNGIVALPDDGLLVADFHGLAWIHAAGGPALRIERLATPADLYLGGVDGLAAWRHGIVAVQNLVGRTRIWALSLDTRERRVTDARVLMRGHADFRNPTTGAVVGDRFVIVADTKLQEARPDGTLSPLPAGRTGHRVLELRLVPAR